MATIIEDDSGLPNYDQFQQIHCLNAASNVVGLKTGTVKRLEAAFKETLDSVLPKLSPEGQWKTAWGPAVYSPKPNEQTTPLNAWYAAQNDQDKLLVVAIAGTAALSIDAWKTNCAVDTVVRWDDWISQWTPMNIPEPQPTTQKTDPVVSYGTCTFVRNILTYASPSTGEASGTLLGTFLKSFISQNSDYSIVFTGHSLGGAVSPCLALGLVQTVLKGFRVNTQPSAGASPGNAAFNSIFEESFPPQDRYNVVVYNRLDLVPQAWCVNPQEDRNLQNILTIYNDVGPLLKGLIRINVAEAIRLSKKGTEYVGLPGKPFDSTRNVPVINTPGDLQQEARYQHIKAYWKEFGITDFVALFSKGFKAQPGIRDSDVFGDFKIPDNLQDATEADGVEE